MTAVDPRPLPIEGGVIHRYMTLRGECPDCRAPWDVTHRPECRWGGRVGQSRTRMAHQSPDWPPTPKL